MGLTITNTNTLQLLNILNRTSQEQSSTLQKLSTGYRINSGRDDPAGLIAVNNLGAELTAVDAAIASGQRANSFLAVADGAFTEISSLLSQIESLTAASTSSAGLSAAEIAANQSQIDSAIDSIDRISNTTTFNGKKLLDGSQSIRTSSDATATTDLADVRVYSRRASVASDTVTVTVNTAGKVASALVATPVVVSAASFSVAGKLGTATITVGAGDTLATIRTRIVAAAGETGVSARLSTNNSSLILVTRDTGSASFLSVSRISGDSDFQNVAYTAGTDAVVTVNGQQLTADGLNVSFNSNGISGSFTLTSTGNAAGSAGVVTVNGGGATFQLGTGSTTRATIGLDAIGTPKLGDNSVGYLNQLKSGGTNSLSSNATNALSIVRSAISQIATAQGRIGGFQKFTVQSSLNSLDSAKKSLSDARSAIGDTDFAQETSNLNRQNVLLQSATQLLGVANQQTGQILSLLR